MFLHVDEMCVHHHLIDHCLFYAIQTTNLVTKQLSISFFYFLLFFYFSLFYFTNAANNSSLMPAVNQWNVTLVKREHVCVTMHNIVVADGYYCYYYVDPNFTHNIITHSLFLFLSLLCVCVCDSDTYDKKGDSFNIFFLIVPTFVLGALTTEYYTFSEVTQHNTHT